MPKIKFEDLPKIKQLVTKDAVESVRLSLLSCLGPVDVDNYNRELSISRLTTLLNNNIVSPETIIDGKSLLEIAEENNNQDAINILESAIKVLLEKDDMTNHISPDADIKFRSEENKTISNKESMKKIMPKNNKFIGLDELLVSEKYSKNDKDIFVSLLNSCLKYNMPGTLEKLLEKIPANTSMKEESLLEIAVKNNNLSAVKVLVSKGATINNRNRDSILFSFNEEKFNGDSIEILKVLLANKVNIDELYIITNDDGETKKTALEIFKEKITSSGIVGIMKKECLNIINPLLESKDRRQMVKHPNYPLSLTISYINHKNNFMSEITLPSFLESDSDEDDLSSISTDYSNESYELNLFSLDTSGNILTLSNKILLEQKNSPTNKI